MSDPSRLFQSHVRQITDSAADDWLASILNKELTELTAQSSRWSSSPCLIADLGEVLLRATHLLSQLANGLANGAHVETYIRLRAQEASAETDFSELRPIEYCDEKHSSLRQVASELGHVHETITKTWRASPAPPFRTRPGRKASEMSSPASESAPPAFETRACFVRAGAGAEISPTAGHSWQIKPNGDTADDQDRDDIQADLQAWMADQIDTLSHRGKGRYECPLGKNCTKAGKGVVFERNSDFKEHLEKHVKMYKCELPGCRNKAGFARRDQLERHQKKVPHDT